MIPRATGTCLVDGTSGAETLLRCFCEGLMLHSSLFPPPGITTISSVDPVIVAAEQTFVVGMVFMNFVRELVWEGRDILNY